MLFYKSEKRYIKKGDHRKEKNLFKELNELRKKKISSLEFKKRCPILSEKVGAHLTKPKVRNENMSHINQKLYHLLEKSFTFSNAYKSAKTKAL